MSPDQPLTRIGRHEIVRLLGQGGMGSVYLARDPVIGRSVAIKLISQGLDDPRARERVAREAKAAGHLHHPNIVTVFDVGEHDGQLFIAMEYVRGESLAALLRKRALKTSCRTPGSHGRGLRRPRVRAPRRHRSPRRQARQPDDQRGRPPQGSRLRNSQGVWGRKHPDIRVRHPALHVARAAHGRIARSSERRVRAGVRDLRDCERGAGVRRQRQGCRGSGAGG